MAARMRSSARRGDGVPLRPGGDATGTAAKDPDLVFANRGPGADLRPGCGCCRSSPPCAAAARVAPGGGQRRLAARALEAQADRRGWPGRVQFVGRLDAATQAGWYDRARGTCRCRAATRSRSRCWRRWPTAACPLLSDLPANRELVRHGDNGLILPTALAGAARLDALLQRAATVAGDNRAWVRQHALFAPAVQAFVERLRATLASPTMNILYLNHYAGSPTLGMEYRPYYLAREWVRAGPPGADGGADHSHVRARQPAPATRCRRHRLPLGAHAALPRQRPGSGAQHLDLPEPVWRDTDASGARVRPEVVIASSTYPMDIWVARRMARAGRRDGWSTRCTTCGRCRRWSCSTCRAGTPSSCCARWPRTPPTATPTRGLDAAQGARLHGLARPGPAQAVHRAQRHHAGGMAGRCRSAGPGRAAHAAGGAAAGRTLVGYAGSHGVPNALDTCSTPPRCCARADALRAGRRRPRETRLATRVQRRRAAQREPAAGHSPRRRSRRSWPASTSPTSAGSACRSTASASRPTS
jgi:hypothetical protein